MLTTAKSVRDAFHYLYPDELPFLKKLVASIKNDNPIVVNIGAGSGTSGLAILENGHARLAERPTIGIVMRL